MFFSNWITYKVQPWQLLIGNKINTVHLECLEPHHAAQVVWIRRMSCAALELLKWIGLLEFCVRLIFKAAALTSECSFQMCSPFALFLRLFTWCQSPTHCLQSCWYVREKRKEATNKEQLVTKTYHHLLFVFPIFSFPSLTLLLSLPCPLLSTPFDFWALYKCFVLLFSSPSLLCLYFQAFYWDIKTEAGYLKTPLWAGLCHYDLHDTCYFFNFNFSADVIWLINQEEKPLVSMAVILPGSNTAKWAKHG